ncbi:hypothetical protein M409DRAFT_17583 [Zasmidium cellare ATCC 36951]|uniref:Zn(2)-C6 fungal-type domain-containing protein n=1 Tax=Zasmidium cellare ATCC 36951 TaxID=1080233 RepID=A0A6A6D1P7_ZASCE|nr:uncharacterized protein M409DRAFT_17583 [Zasmidium cellare ATCC 36951]KAF2172348.1 hypothetical protein M409DRAFT_17583 [Zasmidium cellare ATCC 36951]
MSEDTNGTANGASQAQTQQTLNNLANGAHLKQKRARSQLSCIPCRQGKLKCNRSHDPACDQCIKRNRESSCLYVPPPVKQKPAQNVKGRIRQLENLVVDLMNQQSTKNPQTNGSDEQEEHSPSDESPTTNGHRRSTTFSQPTPPSDNDSNSPNNVGTAGSGSTQDDVDGATKPFGQMRISKNEISYVGETHWQAILNGISELKRDLGDNEDGEGDQTNGHTEPEEPDTDLYGNAFGNVPLTSLPGGDKANSPPHATTGLGFLIGSSNFVSREQLISSVPEKRVADRLLSLWFNSPDPFKPIIHAPTFQDEYRRFWRNPQETPTMWLGLLYAILSLAASFGLRDSDPTSAAAQAILADVNEYHTLCGSAAVMADFTKPKQYTIECLILYSAGLRSNDAFVNVWLMIGLIVRLALRMGYHRDPASYPAISTFDGEMRRRVWAIISMIDVLISFQLGLPSMVRTLQSDTQSPRNLLDRDFNVNTKVLPPSRGIDELTPSSYTRAKLRITRIFADASELSHATIPPSHEEMMELDRKLEEARAHIPPLLQMPDISELVTDPAEQLMCRFNLDLLYLKVKMVLHRRYMEKPFAQLSPHEQQMGIGISRKACTSCALRVLQHHHTIYTASQPGGQLESVKWYMGSISTHDFLLAAMIICLELSQQISPDSAVMNPGGRLCPQRAAMMDALEKSQKIWSDASKRKRRPNQFVAKDEHARGEHMFDETEKASRAMAVMLEKVKARFPQQANALAQFQEDTPSQMAFTNEELGIPTPMHTSTGERPQFGGMVSYHQWDNMTGVPDGLTLNNNAYAANTGSTNGATSLSQSNSNDTSPEQDGSLPDFSMIGDMLDMPGNIDWDMFDQGMTKRTAQFTEGQLNDNTFPMNGFGGTPGTMDMPIAGNAMVGGGTGPGSGQYPPSWMTFDNMEDVNFDMTGIENYDKAGFFSPTGRNPNSWRDGAV